MKRKTMSVIAIGLMTGMLVACGTVDSGIPATDIQSDIATTELSEDTPEPTISPEEEIEEALTEGRNYYYGYNNVTADNDKAMEAFEKAADLGSADAFYYIARIQDRAEEYDKAKESYEKAIELGSSMSKLGLGMLYQKGKGVKKDFDKARALYEEAIDEGCIEANVGLGDIYQGGYGIDVDAVKSMEYFELATTGDETEWVCYAYGSLCVLNQGTYEGIEKNEDIITEYGEKLYDLCSNWNPNYISWVGDAFWYAGNFDEAKKYYEKGEELNDAASICSLGNMYYEVEKDYDKAKKYYEKGEELNDAASINMLGSLYFYGNGVEKDYDKALEYDEKAGSLGYILAMKNAAYIYRHDEYGKQDIEKAIEWYEKAAELNDAFALNELGYIYQYGEGVEKDYDKAISYYERGVALDDPSCIYNLGAMYHNGEGVDVDYKKTAELLEKIKEITSEESDYYKKADTEIKNMISHGEISEEDL